MTRQNLTQFIIASLILLGDFAFASEVNPRNDAEAVINGSTAQSSQIESPNDPGTTWQPLFMGAELTQNNATLNHQTITTSVYSHTYSCNYSFYVSRAPPVSL